MNHEIKQEAGVVTQWGSGVADVNKIRKDVAANFAWQWDNRTASMLDVVKVWPDNQAALNWLKEWQNLSPQVRQLFEVAVEQVSDFWDLAIYSARVEANFDTLRSNLEWQWDNNRASLVNCNQAWEAKQVWQAYYHLLWGQRHNPSALENYRACWSKDQNWVMSLVAEVVTT